MKIKYLMMVSLMLAILTIGAVSASEDISDDLTANNETVGEITSIEETSPDSDDVVASADDGDVLEYAKSDVLTEDQYVDVYSEADILDEDEIIALVEDDDCINGTVTVFIDGSSKLTKSFIPDERKYMFEITVGNLNLYNNIAVGNHNVKVVYMKDGTQEHKVENSVIFYARMNDDDYLHVKSEVNILSHEDTVASVSEDYDYIEGTVTVYLDNNKKLTKNFQASDKTDYYSFTVDDLGIYNSALGKHIVKIEYVKNGNEKHEAMGLIEFIAEPIYEDYYAISTIEKETLVINYLKGFTGTATLYKGVKIQDSSNPNDYHWEKGTDVVGSAKFSNGVASIPFGPLAKGYHNLFLTISGIDYEDRIGIDVSENTPGLSASLSASQITVGKSVTVKFGGVKSDDTVSIYLDDKLFKSVSLNSGSVSETINGLAVGTHKIKVLFEGGDKFYSNSFYVTVKAKDKIQLTLKKVKVKKSAKKLVLQATLKINGKKVKGKVIKFKFNKKTLKAKTNKKGIAKVTVKKKFLKKLKVGKKVKYQATYDKVTKKVTVKVKK